MSYSKKGFTLVEILAAIVLFSIIISIAFGSFRMIHSSSEHMGRSSVEFEMAQNCLSRMTTDLQSIYVSQPPAYQKPEFDADPDPYRISGDNSYSAGDSFARLRFTSLSHLPMDGSDQSGIAQIVYYVYGSRNDGYSLRRSDQLFPYELIEESANDPVLCENIHSAIFSYTDSDGEKDTVWDSPSTGMPRPARWKSYWNWGMRNHPVNIKPASGCRCSGLD
ncbi:MAG: prepilin-type N-terminal cleavage/methylation domain-containing protein [Deltaproteobacteria bacterium]|nr:prepilin-type N-terminal cleavage/methylation domain-containing protein [Deltaproteobacteria bacterium]